MGRNHHGKKCGNGHSGDIKIINKCRARLSYKAIIILQYEFPVIIKYFATKEI